MEIGEFTFTYIELICIAAFGLGIIVQFWNFIFKMIFVLGKRKTKTSGQESPSISIIITARNYEQELRENLPGILEQEYKDFEVVVVDDCSYDRTSECVAELKLKYPNLKTTTIRQETAFSNALAISLGVRAASKEWIIFLHPQCRLSNSEWLKSFSKNLDGKKDFVFGFTRLINITGFFNKLAHYSNFYQYIFFGGAFKAGNIYPYSDINLAYKRQLFLEKKGFAGQLDSRFCENELFVNKLAVRNNFCMVPDGKTAVDFNGELSWGDWMNLRKKHLLLKKELSLGKRFYMRMDVVARVSVNLFFILLLAVSKFYLWALAVWTVRFLSESSLAIIAKKRLKERSVIPGILLYEIFLPFFDVIVWWSLLFEGRKKRWK